MIVPALLAGLCVFTPWQAANTAGVYIDVAGDVAFLLAPSTRELSGRVVRSNGESVDASIYFIDARFPLKSHSLVELNLPFISIVDPPEVVTGFGDFAIRARTHLYTRPGLAFRLLGGIRTGTGTNRVYPYSSQSLDLEAGIGYVDTLDMFDVWAAAGGAYVAREPEYLPEEDLHGHHGRVSAGLSFPFRSVGLDVGMSVMAVFYEAGRAREIYLGTVDYRRSQWFSITFAVHLEGGDVDERVGDTAVTGGLRVFY
jgi:hypothetical protein